MSSERVSVLHFLTKEKYIRLFVKDKAIFILTRKTWYTVRYFKWSTLLIATQFRLQFCACQQTRNSFWLTVLLLYLRPVLEFLGLTRECSESNPFCLLPRKLHDNTVELSKFSATKYNFFPHSHRH